VAAQETQPEVRSRRSLLRQERSRETRRRFVRAAAKLWSEQGYDATTIEQLCAEARVSRPTFYLHFETKDQLLQELAWATTDGLSKDLQSDGSVDADIDAFVRGLARRMEKIPKTLAALVLARVTAGPAPDLLPSGRIHFEDLLTAILERGQANGEVNDQLDPARVGAVLGGMTMDALQRWARTEKPARAGSLRDALAFRFAIVLDGIRS
jgi:AcrR family transcriptional regulator